MLLIDGCSGCTDNNEFLLVKKLKDLTDEVSGRLKRSNETPNGDEWLKARYR